MGYKSYTLSIKTVKLNPTDITVVSYEADTYKDILFYLFNFFDNLPDIYNTDFRKRFSHAIKRYTKNGRIPVIFSHPEKGRLLRHMIIIRKSDLYYSEDDTQKLSLFD